MNDRPVNTTAMICMRIYARVFSHLARINNRPNKAIARAADCSEAYISLIKKGERLPTLETTMTLDQAISGEGCLFEVRRLIEQLQDEIAASGRNVKTRLVVSGKEQGPVKRRELLQDGAKVTAGATIAPVLAALTQAWQVSEPKIPGASVSQAMIDDWENAAIVYGQRARREPPATILEALADEFSAIAPHLAREQPEEVRKGLTHAAAQHALLIAGKFVDLGDRRESGRWWAKTRALSDESGDIMLASWVRSREVLSRRGDASEDPAELLVLAQEAQQLVGDRPSAPLSSALAAEAMLLAQLGRFDEAVIKLRQAEMAFERMPASTILDPNWAKRGEGLWFDKSLIYTLANDVKHAKEAQDTVLSGRSPEDGLTATSVRLHAAAVQARTDPKTGMEEAARIIDAIPPQYRRTRHLSAARLALDLAPEKARSLPVAKDLRELTEGV
ncbi:hypothetical protein GCM10022416_48930 [Actinomadura keratinilytica]|uniref:XRE family transcriptional regulator n=2 Tax=Actinomadura keratinilytica TaxID=547461 RepID=A0ABP7ZAM1_9ACTN